MAAKKKPQTNGKAPAQPRVSKPSIHVEGFPTDDDGQAVEDAVVPLDVLRRIPIDASSSRARQEASAALRGKANGQKGVKLPSEPIAKFHLLKQLHPSSYVTFKKLMPEEDDGIPPRQLSLFQNYDAMVKYLRDQHYDGRQSSYEWTIRDNAYSPWGKGLVQLGERIAPQPQPEEDEDEMARRGQPPQYGAPQQYPPQAYYPNPSPYPPQPYPPPGYYYPPAPAPAPAPAPVPEGFTLSPAQLMQMSMAGQQAGVPPEILGQFLQMFERLSQNNATLTEQLRQQRQAPPPQAPQPMPYPMPQPAPDQTQVFMPYLMQMMELVMKGKDPSAAPPPPPPPPPAPPLPDPVQVMENGLGMLMKLSTLQQRVVKQFAPQQPQPLHENPVADSPEDDMPYIFKDMGPIRAVISKDGEPVDLITKTVFNMDKIGSFVENIADRLEARKQRQQQQPQVIDNEASVIHQKAADLRAVREEHERILEIRQQLAQTPAPLPAPAPQPQLNPQFVRVIDAPPEPEPAPAAPAPAPAPAPEREVLPLAIRLMQRPASLPDAVADSMPVEALADAVPPEDVEAEEAVADTEPPPPPVVADTN